MSNRNKFKYRQSTINYTTTMGRNYIIALSALFIIAIILIAVYNNVILKTGNFVLKQQEVIENFYGLKDQKNDGISVTVKPLKEIYLFDEEVWCSFVINNQSNEPYALTTPIKSSTLDITLINPRGESIEAIGSAEYIDNDFDIIPPQSESNKYIFSLFTYMLNADIDIDNGIGNYTMFVNYQGINSNISQFKVQYPANASDVYLYNNYSVNKIIDSFVRNSIDSNNVGILFEDILNHKESAYAPKLYSTALYMLYKFNEYDKQKLGKFETYFDDYIINFPDSHDMLNYIIAYDRFLKFKKGERGEVMTEVLNSLRQRTSSETVQSIIDMRLRAYQF